MRELGKYDTSLQMFVETPRDADMNHLRFMRRLAEAGKFSNRPLSIPKGADLFRLTNVEIAAYAMQQADQTPDQKLRQHIAASGGY